MKRPEGFDPRDEAELRPKSDRRSDRSPGEPARKPAHPSPEGAREPSTPRKRRTPADPAARQARSAARLRRRAELEEVRRFTRRSRHRRVVWAISVGTVAILLGLIAVAVWSPLLALREIRVVGTSAVNPDEVSAAASSQLGTPLALLNEDQLREALAGFPLIQSYSTELLPPGTWVIHVTERAAIAVIGQQDQFVSIDPVGVTIHTFDSVPESLPLLVVPEAHAGAPAFDSAIAVLRALPDQLRAEVEEIQASTEDDVTLELRGSTARVRWGSADRSAMKARVFETLRNNQGQEAAVEYDVTAPSHVVVRPL